MSASSLRKFRNAFSFRAARELDEAAAVAAVSPELRAGAPDDDERILLRPVGNPFQTDAQAGS